jgi:hypothetical protein
VFIVHHFKLGKQLLFVSKRLISDLDGEVKVDITAVGNRSGLNEL